MRLVRVAACTATAALLTVVTGTGTAAAATQKKGLLYSATTGTGVVQVQLTLPVALPAVPNPTVLTLIGSDGQLFRGATGADVATARSFLAGGNLVTDSALSGLLTPLNRIVSSTLAAPGTHTATALAVPNNVLGLGLSVGDQIANVNALSRLAGSGGELTSATLGSLRTLGLGAALDTSLATLTTAIGTVTGQASALTTALSLLPTIPAVTVPNPLAGIVPGVPATITTPSQSGAALAATIAGLPAQVTALLAKLTDGAAVALGTATTTQSITPHVSSLVSTAQTNAADISLFGGLVTISATKAAVGATAGLTATAGKATASATLLTLKVSDDLTTLLSLAASDKGISAQLLDGSLLGVLSAPLNLLLTTLNGALDTVLAQLTDLLTSLNSGASLITQGTATHKVSANGRTAEAHAVPARVTVGLPVAPDLLVISIGKADILSAVSQAAPAVVTPPTDTPTQLPHTGGSTDLALMALVLMTVGGGLVVLRRRQTA